MSADETETAESIPSRESSAVPSTANLTNLPNSAMPREAEPPKNLALPDWTEEQRAKLRAWNAGKNVVCILGFAPTTRHLALYDDPSVEIWSLNEAHRHHPDGYLKRFTRWFQFHQTWDFTKATSQATKEHWAWLQQPHDFPIYMQKVDPRVPASVRYPFDEIVQTILGHTMRLNEKADAEITRYFTSSFAYQAALVAYEKKAGIKDWDRVFVFGYEMATNTEFQYQKGSTEWWLGKLDGMGIEVVVPPKCRLLHGSLYGYEVSRVLNKEMLEKLLRAEEKKERDQLKKTAMASGRREAIEQILRETFEALDNPISEAHRMDLEARRLDLAPKAKEAFRNEVELARDMNVLYGRIQELTDLITYTNQGQTEILSGGESAPLVNRQLLEARLQSIRHAENDTFQKVLVQRGRRLAIRDVTKNIPAEKMEEHQAYGAEMFQSEMNQSSMTNALIGRREMALELVRFLDNLDNENKVIHILMENDPLKKSEGF